jgi:hypothetical protein
MHLFWIIDDLTDKQSSAEVHREVEHIMFALRYEHTICFSTCKLKFVFKGSLCTASSERNHTGESFEEVTETGIPLGPD